MALTFLGVRTIRFEDGWVEFDPISLGRRRGYYLEATFNNNNGLESFSYFNFGYTFQVDDGSLLTVTLPNNYYVDSRTHGIPVSDILEIDQNVDVIFLCRRLPIVRGFTTVADISVSLSLDPDITF